MNVIDDVAFVRSGYCVVRRVYFYIYKFIIFGYEVIVFNDYFFMNSMQRIGEIA